MHPDHLPLWAPHITEIKHISGPIDEAGAKYEIHMNVNGVSIIVIETFIERNFPDYFSCSFEQKGIWQGSENWLEDLPDGRTLWRSRSTIEPISFFAKMTTCLMPWTYKSYVRNHLQYFKAYAEEQ